MAEKEDWAAFAEAVRRIPPPLTCFSDGAGCPWCGSLHRTVTFGKNQCVECDREFYFGYPDWHSEKDPVSYVPFPHYEIHRLGNRYDLLPEWKPNERLKHLYFQKTEERLGVSAHDSAPQ